MAVEESSHLAYCSELLRSLPIDILEEFITIYLQLS